MVRDTWWVQYFNSSDSLIPNTIEVTDLPDVPPAAAEDYADSIVRLGETPTGTRDHVHEALTELIASFDT